MGEYRNNDCCEPKECCCHSQSCYQNSCGNDNNLGMIILILVVLFLFCGNDNKGGLFGGLF